MPLLGMNAIPDCKSTINSENNHYRVLATMSEETSNPKEQESDQAKLAAKLPKIISFDSLSRCGDEVWIENEGQIYRLRRTRQGKLILTK